MQRNIKLPGGCHKGELTKLGQQQARDVGEWLRQRYVQDLSFLPAQYEVGCTESPIICITLLLSVHQSNMCDLRQTNLQSCSSLHKTVLACLCCTQHAQLALSIPPLCSMGFICCQDGAVSGRTTNFSRTIATLQGVLTGLYPEAAQPIPVATASDMDEIMFANVLSCERLADVMKRARYELRGKALPMILTLLLSRHCHFLEQQLPGCSAIEKQTTSYFECCTLIT